MRAAAWAVKLDRLALLLFPPELVHPPDPAAAADAPPPAVADWVLFELSGKDPAGAHKTLRLNVTRVRRLRSPDDPALAQENEPPNPNANPADPDPAAPPVHGLHLLAAEPSVWPPSRRPRYRRGSSAFTSVRLSNRPLSPPTGPVCSTTPASRLVAPTDPAPEP